MIYGIKDMPRTLSEWFLFTIQQVLSVFVATLLIAKICNTPTDACLIGACLGTLVYQIITKFRSPMFISSCGATAGAVISALSIGGYTAVFIGGTVMCVIYCLFALLVKKYGVNSINKFLPPTIVGTITLVIGINLSKFIPTYLTTNGVITFTGTLVAIFTMLVIALCSYKGKGILKSIPFLVGLAAGYILALVITLLGIAPLVDLSLFNNVSLFQIPDFTFKYIDFGNITSTLLLSVLIIYLPVSLAGLCEHISDHKVLSNIIKTDLTTDPGLDKTLIGDGVASMVGSFICGLQNTSYGESIATIGMSKVASVAVITTSALTLGVLAFIGPVQALIASIPSVCFAGAAMVLYGYIASSGLRTLIDANIDFSKNKNLIIISVILTSGVSGMFFYGEVFSGVSLALVLGILLNLILKESK